MSIKGKGIQTGKNHEFHFHLEIDQILIFMPLLEDFVIFDIFDQTFTSLLSLIRPPSSWYYPVELKI